MILEVVLGAVVLFLLSCAFRKPKDLPPGRWGLPLIGYIPFTKKSVDDQLLDLQKKYGDIYIWRMGTQVMVFIHDYHLVKETFSRPEFINRPEWEIFKANQPVALGISTSNGSIWNTSRRFSLRQLRDLGMGKSSLVGAIHTQATKFVDALKAESGKAAPFPHDLNVAIVNVIWQMVAGKQFDTEDPALKEFEQIIKDLNASVGWLIVADLLPWLRKIAPKFIMNWIFGLDDIDKEVQKFIDFFNVIIKEHEENLDRDAPKDFIDAYLMEMGDEKSQGNPDLLRKDADLALVIFDIFFAGSDTTISTLQWIFLYMAAHPHIQCKMQAEIDKVLPNGAMAALDDRSKLPYTEAVINEVLRQSTLASVGVQHSAVQDAQLGGYTIPKGTVINSVIATIHHDTRYWENPHQFLPERWLDGEGKFVSKKEGFLPFGIGKRVCIGEALARMELLVFVTAVFQSLNISAAPGKAINLQPRPENPLAHEPIMQDVVFTKRT